MAKWRFGTKRFLVLWALSAHCVCLSQPAQQFDLVLANGRVIDPETSFDAMRQVGIVDGRIAAISATPLKGAAVLDVHGLIITAGFIDLHSHGQTRDTDLYKVRDGVTTALEMEIGVQPVADWYARRTGKALVNFGASSGYIAARMMAKGDNPGSRLVPRVGVDRSATEIASPTERKQILDLVRRGLEEGALGVGVAISYTPTASRQEIQELFDVASDHHVPVYAHPRYAGPAEPGGVDALQELLSAAF